jgi:hypothetical protein
LKARECLEVVHADVLREYKYSLNEMVIHYEKLLHFAHDQLIVHNRVGRWFCYIQWRANKKNIFSTKKTKECGLSLTTGVVDSSLRIIWVALSYLEDIDVLAYATTNKLFTAEVWKFMYSKWRKIKHGSL